MRIKQLIIHSSLSKMKHKILPTYLQGNYKESLREFGSTLYGVFGAEGLGGTPVAKSHFPEMNVK